MLVKKVLLVLFFLVSALNGSVDFPKVYGAFEKINNADRIKKLSLSKDKKRLLVMRHNSVSLMDAKTLKVLKRIEFEGSSWNSDFVEDGFVLLTHLNFSYYDKTGTKLIFNESLRTGRRIKKINVHKNGYMVNIVMSHAILTFNVRTKQFKKIISKEPNYRDDIRDDVLRTENKNDRSYIYTNIYTKERVDFFPSENILPNGKQIIDLKDFALKNVAGTNVIQSYGKPAGRVKFGCMAPSGQRFAILTNSEPVHVYDVDKKEPIFSLPRNLNTSKTRDCLLYDDTLILWGKSMQVYNLKDAKKINSAVSPSLKIMPIIGSCTDAPYGVSLWINTMYGWNVEKGKMRWYFKGPKFYRSHWENASYLIEIQADKKFAFVRPFGQRSHKELKVFLENGSFIEWDKGYKYKRFSDSSVVCDPGSGEVWLEKEFSFTLHGVSFYALSQGEWLVISNSDGYFNASSKNALSLLHKAHNTLTDRDIKKWYRPDIIQAKLSNKKTAKLSKVNTHYKLPEKSQLINHYFSSIVQGVKTGHNYKKLLSLMQQTDLDQLDEIINALPNDEKGYFYFYRALRPQKRFYKQPELFSFLNQRAEKLSSYSNEVPALLEYLISIQKRTRIYKNNPLLKEGIPILYEKIWRKYKDHERVKLMIASMRTTDEAYKTIYWDIWEQQNYITKEHLQVLYQEDPLRSQRLAVKSLTNLLNKLEKSGCKEDQLNTNICQDDFEMRTYGTFWTRISTLYDFLIENKTALPLDELKIITAKKVKVFYANKDPDKLGINAKYIKFYAKYSNEGEKKELIQSTKKFLEKAIFQTEWSNYWSVRIVQVINSKIRTVHKGMLETMPEYFLELGKKLIDSDNKYLHEHLDYLITDIEENPFVQKAMVKSVLNQFHDNGYVDYKYIGRLLNTDSKEIHLQVIEMFNLFNDCNKIRDNYRYKLKSILSLKDYMRLECAPLPNESIPYNKREEYAPLYKIK